MKIITLVSWFLVCMSITSCSSNRKISRTIASLSTAKKIMTNLDYPQIIIIMKTQNKMLSILKDLKSLNSCVLWGERESENNPSYNGVDDDGNGFIDDKDGWSFIKNSPFLPLEIKNVLEDLPRYNIEKIDFRIDNYLNCLILVPVVLDTGTVSEKQKQAKLYLNKKENDNFPLRTIYVTPERIFQK